MLADDQLLERYLEDCEALLDHARLRADHRALADKPVLFEGAHGLMLDQDYGAFPHVTRSNTGIRNMLVVAAEAGIDAIEATYVTRAYVTRHGAGPLAHEADGLDGFDIVDPTNEPNPWQGTIRHAALDLDVLAGAVAHDLDLSTGHSVAVSPRLQVGCLDQANGEIRIWQAGQPEAVKQTALPQKVAAAVGIPLGGEGWGPRRQDQITPGHLMAA